ncbi:unnamed protein product, partial [Brassica rapa]
MIWNICLLVSMYVYHLAPLNGGEGQFHLRPRSGLPIVEELPKGDRKGSVFNKKMAGEIHFYDAFWIFLSMEFYSRDSSCSRGKRENRY